MYQHQQLAPAEVEEKIVKLKRPFWCGICLRLCCKNFASSKDKVLKEMKTRSDYDMLQLAVAQLPRSLHKSLDSSSLAG